MHRMNMENVSFGQKRVKGELLMLIYAVDITFEISLGGMAKLPVCQSRALHQRGLEPLEWRLSI